MTLACARLIIFFFFPRRSLAEQLRATCPNSSVVDSPLSYSASGESSSLLRPSLRLEKAFATELAVFRLSRASSMLVRPAHDADVHLLQDVRLPSLVALAKPVWRPCGWSFLRPVRRSGRMGSCTDLPHRIESSCFPWSISWPELRTCILPLWSHRQSLTNPGDSFPSKQQLGNMVSSSAAQIESVAGDNIQTKDGKPDYGKIGAILIGVRILQLYGDQKYIALTFATHFRFQVVAAWIIGCCLIGAEQHGSHFEKGKAAFEVGAGRDEIEERELNFDLLFFFFHPRRGH